MAGLVNLEGNIRKSDMYRVGYNRGGEVNHVKVV